MRTVLNQKRCGKYFVRHFITNKPFSTVFLKPLLLLSTVFTLNFFVLYILHQLQLHYYSYFQLILKEKTRERFCERGKGFQDLVIQLVWFRFQLILGSPLKCLRKCLSQIEKGLGLNFIFQSTSFPLEVNQNQVVSMPYTYIYSSLSCQRKLQHVRLTVEFMI